MGLIRATAAAAAAVTVVVMDVENVAVNFTPGSARYNSTQPTGKFSITSLTRRIGPTVGGRVQR